MIAPGVSTTHYMISHWLGAWEWAERRANCD